MKRATENQVRARRGHGCLFSMVKRSCGEAPEVEIEGVKLRVCALHEKRIREIVADKNKQQPRKLICAGEIRFTSYETFRTTVRPMLDARYGSVYDAVRCSHCNGWHLVVREELAA